MSPMSQWKASSHCTQRRKHAKPKIRGNKQMHAQKEIHTSQSWQQGQNDVTFSHMIPLYWRL